MKENYSGNPVAMKVAAWRLNHPTSGLEEASKELHGISKEDINALWDGVDKLYDKSDGAHFHFLGAATEQDVTALFKEHGL